MNKQQAAPPAPVLPLSAWQPIESAPKDGTNVLLTDAEKLLPHGYLLAKVAMVVPLLEEARDALTAITEHQRRLHGISPTLADRMDVAGTYSLEDWQAALASQPGAGGE